MGSHNQVDLGSLTIANNGSASDSMDFTGWRGAARAIGISPPGTLTNAVKVQVSEDNSAWRDLQSAGADVTVPADGFVVIKDMSWKYMRLLSAGAEGAARTFVIKGEEGY